MVAVVRAASSTNSGSGTATTFTPPQPTGAVAGDLLIGIACNGSGLTPSARPSGSTTVASIADGTTYFIDIVRKTAAGSDVFTWTTASAARWAGGIVAVFKDTWNTTTPISSPSATAQGTTASITFTTSSQTPPGADSLIIAAFGAQAVATWTCTNTNPSMTELIDTSGSGTGAVSASVYRSTTPPLIAALTRSGTSTVSSANGAMAIMFVNSAPSVSLVMAPHIIR